MLNRKWPPAQLLTVPERPTHFERRTPRRLVSITVQPPPSAPVLAFELENRSYFSASVSDRGDEFFAQFTERFCGLLAEQEAGTSAFYVMVDRGGAVLGRFNLYDIVGGTARVGYRVGEQVAGRGVATAGVCSLCGMATGLGLSTLTAAVSDQNIASSRVLIKTGFVRDGPAEPSEPGGQQGDRFRCDMTSR